MSPIATVDSSKITYNNVIKPTHRLIILGTLLLIITLLKMPQLESINSANRIDDAQSVGHVKRLAQPNQAQRSPYIVNALEDDSDADVGDGLCNTVANKCTLRAAIQEAQSPQSSGADRIEISSSGQIEFVNGPLPDIVDSITIVGTDQLTLDGGERSRLFSIKSQGILRLEKLTLANGETADSTSNSTANGGLLYNEGTLSLQNVILSGGKADQGGAIYNTGHVNLVQVKLRDNRSRFHGGAIYTTGDASRLTLDNVTLESNHATLGYGGAIYSELGATVEIERSQLGQQGLSNGANRGAGIYSSGGAMTLLATTIAYNNAAGNGSGLYITDGGTITVTNSTLSNNRADNDGGAIYLENAGNVRFDYSTLTGNLADSDGNGGGDGGAIAVLVTEPFTETSTITRTGQILFHNSIIAGNADSGNEHPNCKIIAGNNQSALLSTGFNIWGDAIDCPVQENDFSLAALDLTVEQLLQTNLQNYGGATQTHALIPDSLALGQGDPDTCFSVDQRDTARPQGVGCDIGAFEAILIDLALTKSVDPAIVRPGQLLNYKLSIANNGPGPASNVIVADVIPAEVHITGVSSAGLFITEVDAPAIQVLTMITATETRPTTPLTTTVRAWSVGDMAAGESGVILLSGIVTGTAANDIALSPGHGALNQAVILPSLADIDTASTNNLSSVLFHTPHRIQALKTGGKPILNMLDVPLNPQLSLHSTGNIAAIVAPGRTFFVYGMLSGYYTFTAPQPDEGCDRECLPAQILQTTIQRTLQPGEELFATVTADLLDSQAIPHVPHVWQFIATTPYGTGNFNATAKLSSLSPNDNELTTQQAALGDLDGDGDLDALLANRAKPEQVWINDGSGSFRKQSGLTSLTQSWAVALGDLDFDGDLDAFVTGNNPGGQGQTNRVWLNDGSAQFTDSGQLLGAFNSRGVTLGDLNRDGRLDAAIANTDGQPNTVWLNEGSAIFRDSGQQMGTAYSNDVAVGDLDNDGDLDLLFANGRNLARDLSTDALDLDEAANTVWLNDGMGQFQNSQQQLGQFDSQSAALGDVDGDHDLDALIINSSGQENRLWLNDGMGNFTEGGQTLGGGDSRDAALGDLDSDGDLDAIIVGYDQANVAWFNDGKGNFEQDGQQVGYFSSLSIALGDISGDGSLDALITTDGADSHLWFNEATADLAITQRVSPLIVAPGDTITYTIVFTNHGPGAARDVEIRDNLPLGILNLDINLDQANGVSLAETNGTTLVWKSERVEPNSGGTIVVNGNVDPTVAINTILSSAVSIAGEPEVELANNQAAIPLKVGITSVQFTSSVYEVAENGEMARLEIELEKPNPFTDVEISYEIIGGTALAGIDYLRGVTQTGVPTDTPPIAIIPVGETKGVLELPIIDDPYDELDETLLIRLITPQGAFLGAQASTTLTLVDDDPTPTATIHDVNVIENARTVLFDIRLSAPSNLPISVAYRTLDQSATTNNDFTAASGAVNIPPGITQYSLFITLRDDVLYEQDEQFQVALSNPSNAVLTNNRGTATLLDDDPPPILRAAGLTIDEGAGSALVDVQLSEVSGQDVQVDVITLDDSATAGFVAHDYVEQIRRLTIPAGDIGATLPIVIHDDIMDEPDETFFVELRNVQNARLFDDEGSTHLSQIQIIDNDEPPTVDFRPVDASPNNLQGYYRVNEYNAQAILYVQLSAPSSQVITVTYGTSDGSAISVGDAFDYTAISGTLTFEPGITEQKLTIPIRNDSLMEGLETLQITLSDQTHAVLGTDYNPMELSIIDDDGPLPLIDFIHASYEAEENNEAIITVQVVGEPLVDGQNCTQEPATCEQSSIIVDYRADDPLNLLAQPYQGTFTFTADTTTQVLQLATQDDTIYRGDTQIALNLLNSANAHLGANNPARLVIHENDPFPTITLSAPAYQFRENQTTALITATLQGSTTQTATTQYTLSPLHSSFFIFHSSLAFPPGTISQTIAIPLLDDSRDELDEILELRLMEPTYATLGENSTARLTVEDDDPLPVLNFSQPLYTIGESDGIAHLDVTLSAPSALTITVSYVSSDNIAKVDQDYAEATGVLLFRPGVTRQTLQLPILSDEETEEDETFLVSLYGSTNAVLGRNNPTTVQILDNDSILPRVQFHTPVYSTNEGQSATVTVTLSMASTEIVTVDYATADRSAIAEQGEYTPVQGTLVFTPGATSLAFSIATSDDLLDEADKEVALLLSNPINTALGTNALATLTIVDDDELPAVSFEQASYRVTESTAVADVPERGQITVKVALATTSNLTVTINYATVDGTATSGITGDYTAASGELIFPPGITHQSFAVAINTDTENEPDEDMTLRLFNPHNAFLGETDTATLIIEDSNFPVVSFAQPRYEGLENEGSITVDIALSSASVSTVTIEYATDITNDTEGVFGITALQKDSDRDYEPTRGRLQFAPGETQKSFTVVLLDDDVDEQQETISLVLFNPTRAFLDSDARAYIVIIDDDPQPLLRFSNTDYRVNENGTSTTIVVQLSAPSGLTVVADYVVEDVSTTAGTEPDDPGDYQAVTGILRFEPGVTSQTFTIILHDDDMKEGMETAQLKLLNVQNATSQIGVASLTIFDDETPLRADLQQVNFRITGLEVTQGVQNLANAMPLVADRATLVRAYVRAESDILEGVNARLRAFRDGVELAGSPIAANNNPITIRPDGGDRADINDSFWFYVRPAWRSGSVTFAAEVDYDDTQPGSAADNSFNTTVTFYQGQPLRLRTVPVELYNAGNASNSLTYSMSDPQFGRLLDNLLRYHPIPQVDLYPAQTMNAGAFVSPQYTNWNLQEETSQLELLRTLWWTDLFTSGEPQDMHWMAMLHSGINTGKQSAHSLGPGRDFWVKMDVENRIWPAWYLSGGSSMAYAVAYNRGISNIRCAGNEKDVDPNFPWSYAPPPNAQTCSLSAVDPKGYYGLDVYYPSWGQQEPLVISNDPQADYLNRAQPLMSDAHPQWVSPYTYCQLLNSYGVTCDLCTIEPQSLNCTPAQNIRKAALHASLPDHLPDQLQGALLMVGGTVDFIRNERTELREVYLFDDARNALLSDDKIWRLIQPALESLVGSRAPTYTLAQVNSAGETLQSQVLSLRTVDHESQDTYLFFTAMLHMAEMARIELRDESGNVLASRTLTGEPPTVKLLEPSEGALTAGTTVRWQATDPENDPLRFTLLYSPDGGARWQTIALGLTGNEFTLPADAIANLAGSEQGQFQVIAHDGFYTDQDSSAATLQLANKPPVGLLLWPGEESQIEYGKMLLLRGMGTDVEDGSLAADQLQWSSNLDGSLGSGPEVAVDTLSPGNHLILLTVTDSTGTERQAFTTVVVDAPQRQIYLPMVYR